MLLQCTIVNNAVAIVVLQLLKMLRYSTVTDVDNPVVYNAVKV